MVYHRCNRLLRSEEHLLKKKKNSYLLINTMIKCITYCSSFFKNENYLLCTARKKIAAKATSPVMDTLMSPGNCNILRKFFHIFLLAGKRKFGSL